MARHQGMRADFYGDESRSEKSDCHEDARADRQPELRLEHFQGSAPDWSIHPKRDVRAFRHGA
jgi:hypothetical protein